MYTALQVIVAFNDSGEPRYIAEGSVLLRLSEATYEFDSKKILWIPFRGEAKVEISYVRVLVDSQIVYVMVNTLNRDAQPLVD